MLNKELKPMPINFHDPENKLTYSTREADRGWKEFFAGLLNNDIQHAVDIGCGGGIYSKALFQAGIPAVTGVDFSKIMVEAAETNCVDYNQIDFVVGNAHHTGLSGQSYDFVFERAIIHHLNDLSSCFSEASRLLKQDGTIYIQDRTPEDCLLEGTSSHIRGYFFELFPHLKEIERQRRHSSIEVIQALNSAGFTNIEEIKRWEIRQKYTTKKELIADIKERTGRSILHELTTQQLSQLAAFVDQRLPKTGEIIEKDRWTVWVARKK